MDGRDMGQQASVNASLRACRLPSCKVEFEPKRKDHEFHLPECKAEYYRLAYERGVKAMEKPLGRLHAGKVENSPNRLKPILDLLSDGQWHTGLEIALAGNTTAPGSAIQELKHPVNGYNIESRCDKRTASNRPLWEYKLIGRAA